MVRSDWTERVNWWLCVISLFFLVPGCNAPDSHKSKDSALERYINEPRQEARSVKKEVEDGQEERKKELDQLLDK